MHSKLRQTVTIQLKPSSSSELQCNGESGLETAALIFETLCLLEQI